MQSSEEILGVAVAHVYGNPTTTEAELATVVEDATDWTAAYFVERLAVFLEQFRRMGTIAAANFIDLRVWVLDHTPGHITEQGKVAMQRIRERESLADERVALVAQIVVLDAIIAANGAEDEATMLARWKGYCDTLDVADFCETTQAESDARLDDLNKAATAVTRKALAEARIATIDAELGI